MLSISAMGHGQEGYYLMLAREDYYLNGGEPPGQWWGPGAELLGLRGKVQRDQLRSVIQGYSPSDGRKLVMNAGSPKRQIGYDCTFNDPKDISILEVTGGKKIGQEIRAARKEALNAALQYLQDATAFTRRGHGGYEREPAKLVIAMFPHGTSRATEPHAHTHCLVPNVCIRNDGTAGALIPRLFYQHKMTAGAIYQAELAHQVEKRLGLICQRKRTWFELRDVPTKLCRVFSTRRRQIEEKLPEIKKQYQIDDAAAAAIAALDTRDQKGTVPPRKELLAGWKEIAKQYGFTEREVMDLCNRAPTRNHAKALTAAFDTALQRVSELDANFGEKDLLRWTLVSSLGQGIPTGLVRQRVHEQLIHSSDIIEVGRHKHETRYTTREMLAREKRLVEIAAELTTEHTPLVPWETLQNVIAKYSRARKPFIEELKYHASQLVKASRRQDTSPINRETIHELAHTTLSESELKAVHQLTRNSHRFRKLPDCSRFALRAAREAWEQSGYQVLAAAYSRKAVEKLELYSGISSSTLKTLQLKMDPTLSFRAKHQLRQFYWAVRHGIGSHRAPRPFIWGKTYPFKTLRIDKQTILVLDHTNVPRSDLRQILENVRKHGGTVILVGHSPRCNSKATTTPEKTKAHTTEHSHDIQRQAARKLQHKQNLQKLHKEQTQTQEL